MGGIIMKIISMLYSGILIIDHEHARDLTNAELLGILMKLLVRHDKDYLIDMIKEEVEWAENAKKYKGLDGAPYMELKL